jgi:cysteinyl-tRNA synthetase
MLQIHNSLTRRKQAFVPIDPGKVRMYVCGMTVYDYCHLGHARMLVVFDMVYRWLKASGYEVTYVRNITDVEDKIINRAAENNESVYALTARMIEAMNEDCARLLVERPTFEPRATEHVPGMVKMIEALIARGIAYPAANGDVYYAVHAFPGYGKLSGKSLDELRAGERVEIDSNKRDPLDFVLWKAAKQSEPDAVKWDSPWGKGRPGWHIECSVMSEHHLGEHFDIHGGGHDLQFPHHENEIAQSEGVHGHTFVNYWLHNGFLRINDEKMSKSLGNMFLVREVLKVYDPEVVRFFILRGHYRSPLNYTDQHLQDAKNSLDRLYRALRGKLQRSTEIDWNDADAQAFQAAMDDDFNTPEAFAVLFKLADQVFDSGSEARAGLLKALGGALGLLQRDPDTHFRGGEPTQSGAAAAGLTPAQIEEKISQRNAARKAKNFAEADRVRKELLESDIALEDTPQGTIWRRS